MYIKLYTPTFKVDVICFSFFNAKVTKVHHFINHILWRSFTVTRRVSMEKKEKRLLFLLRYNTPYLRIGLNAQFWKFNHLLQTAFK